MRADRLVATLLVLQAKGRVTAAELAEELEVSVKTARRDSGTEAGKGTRTNRVRRTTTGTGRLISAAWTTSAAQSTGSAFSASTSTMARRLETTHNGS